MASGGSIVAGGANDLILNAGESGTPDIYLQSGSSTKVKIEGSNGNVGIGTSSPSAKVDIFDSGAGNANSSGLELTNYDYGAGETGQSISIEALVRNDGGGTSPLSKIIFGKDSDYSSAAARDGNIQFYTNQSNVVTEAMRIDSSGNALVGRTSSLSSQSGSVSANTVVSAHGPLSSHATNAGILEYYNDETLLRSYGANAGAGKLVFKTGGGGGSTDSEAMRIDSSGNLLVGTTSTIPFLLTSGSGAGITSSGTIMGAAAAEAALFNRVSGDGAVVSFFRTGTGVGNISVAAGSTSYNTSSDQRLKDNIADADDAGSKVDSIQVRKFDWKADGSHQDYGMIAQELLEVAPEAVHQPEDSEEMMGVDYSKLVPMLVKEIQSLRNRVAQLEE